jgi:hypothetical protein
MNKSQKYLRNYLNIDSLLNSELFIEIVDFFKKMKKAIIIFLLTSILLSVFEYKNTTPEYKSIAVVLIEQSSSSSTLGNIGGVLGISSNQSSMQSNNLLTPDMYKDIINSKSFLAELITTKFPTNKNINDSTTILEYFFNGEPPTPLQHFANTFKTVNLKNISSKVISDSINKSIEKITPRSLFQNKVPPVIEIDPSINKVSVYMQERIRIEDKGKTIKLTTIMPDPYISAEVGKLVIAKLSNYITLYKTIKQKSNLEYLSEKHLEASNRYEIAQHKLADFKDNSLGIILESKQVEEQTLKNELSIGFAILNQYSTQLEQAKFDLKKETPIFSIIEPISITKEKTKPFFNIILAKNLLYLIILILITMVGFLIKKNK